MKQNNKNILVYIGIIISVIIVIVMAFILGTKVYNNADEKGEVNSNKTSISMTKKELDNYLETFVENFDIEYEKITEVDNSKIFWFAVRTYLSSNKISADSDGIYTLPKKELANIVDKYFGIKDFKYEVGTGDNDLVYDESSDSYKSKLNWGLSVYGEGPEYNITVVDVIDNKDGKIATLKLTYKDSESNNKEFTCILNNNYNITTFKKNAIQNNDESNSNNDESSDKIVKNMQNTKIGNYEFKNTTIEYENGVSTLKTQVTNTSKIKQVIKEFYFHIKDTTGKEITTLKAVVGDDGIGINETKTITLSHGGDITSLGSIEYELGPITKTILGDAKVGNFEFKNTTIEYSDSMSTLKTQLKNTTNMNFNLKEIYFHVKDSAGKELFNLTGYIGINEIAGGETYTIVASYGEKNTSIESIEYELGPITKATLKDVKVGNFEFKNTTIEYKNGMSTLKTHVKNTSSAWNNIEEFNFILRDSAGKELVKLAGYIGKDGINAGETKEIISSYGENITSLASIEYDVGTITKVVLNDKKVNNYRFVNTTIEYKNGMSTLKTFVTNTSDSKQNVEEFFFHVKDSAGKELVVLSGYIGKDGINAGETKVITSLYGEDITSLASIEYKTD